MRCPKCGKEATPGVVSSDGCTDVKEVFVEGGEWVEEKDAYQLEAYHQAYTCPECNTFFTVDE